MKKRVRSMVLLVIDQETGDPGICLQLSWLAEDEKKSCSLFVLGIVTTIMTLLPGRALRISVMFVCNG